MRENLSPSLDLMFGHEGGYVNAKTDAGGPTKYGITHKTLAAHRGVPSVSPADVRAMTIEEADTIYRTSYWGQSGGDVLPGGLDYAVFDFGVNSGPQTAVRKLQEVLKAAGLYTGNVDGWIGEGTLRAVKDYHGGALQLIRDYCDRRMAYLRSLKGKQGFSVNGRGWTVRVTGVDPDGKFAKQPGVVGNAIAMASVGAAAVKIPQPVPAKEVDDAVSAKSEPKKPTILDAVLKPEVALPAASAVATGAARIIAGSNAIQWAIAGAIIIAVAVGAIYAIRRVLKSQG